MRSVTRWMAAALGLALVGAGGPASAQTTSKSSELRQFEIVSVDGNKVVVKGQGGAQEITVPDDF
jgi:hypothetical protein